MTEELWQFTSFNREKNISHGISGKRIASLEDFLGKYGLRNYVLSSQVHGDEIYVADKPARVTAYDGLITAVSGLALIIKSADCAPLLLYDRQKRIIAALHAGRKSTDLHIAAKAVELLKTKFQSDPAKIIVGIGPCICGACYQIDRATDQHFDLRAENKKQLLTAGVLADNIEIADVCTACNGNKDFYSYRQDQTQQRNYSFILINQEA